MFFTEIIASKNQELTLSEDVSKHIIQVLRMQKEEQLLLTDGKGNLLTAVIVDDNKKKCIVRITEASFTPAPARDITIVISLLKNASRFEWFLEKATELGINRIIPIICDRTERQYFRFDRMKGIITSALLQSQQVWLPELQVPQDLAETLVGFSQQQKFIAHCLDDKKILLRDALQASASSKLVMIGPEGDFTKEEIEKALHYKFIAVSLGNNRLRTETAGVVAAVLMTA